MKVLSIPTNEFFVARKLVVMTEQESGQEMETIIFSGRKCSLCRSATRYTVSHQPDRQQASDTNTPRAWVKTARQKLEHRGYSSEISSTEEIQQAHGDHQAQWQGFGNGQQVKESGIRRSTLTSIGVGERTRKQMCGPSNKAIWYWSNFRLWSGSSLHISYWILSQNLASVTLWIPSKGKCLEKKVEYVGRSGK